MSIAVCIMAKDEDPRIATCLRQIAAQSFVSEAGEPIEIHVVANGCSDDTAAVARGCDTLFKGSRATLHVHDLHPGGKSRAWNRAVHELTSKNVQTFIFVDADVTFTRTSIISDMLQSLKADRHLVAFSSFPVKDVETKPDKNPLDRFSLLVSKRTRHVDVINGQLYLARASALREIWLPDQTPGEDGFLNAMLTTRGFSHPADPTLVAASPTPTHYFHSHRLLEFVSHERRMIVGTMINCWIFEHLWSLHLATPAGALIRNLNITDPDWVDDIVSRRASSKWWVIPNAIVFGRFAGGARRSWWKRVSHVPIGAVATLITFLPAILANKRLKEVGAATTW